jgi:hypothetical protein
MGIKAASLRPLVLAAMTMVGGYAQAIDHQAPALRAQYECSKDDMESMRGAMSDLIEGWKDLEGIYAQLLRSTLDTNEFKSETFGRIAELLSMTRGLEVTLRAATPPAAIAALHMEFRRAVAGTRSRLADLDSIYRQATIVPHYVDTHIDLNGLKALADHTTAQVSRIA